MRHSSHTLADEVNTRCAAGESWDILFCSDMLNLPEFLGFVNPAVRDIPSVVYFHENQLTYPVRQESERDIHFGYTNYLTALAAGIVWFNSDFHRRSFLAAVRDLLGRMPDNADMRAVDRIEAASKVMPQGIGRIPLAEQRRPTVPRIVWAARWEHDKNPELFFEALFTLDAASLDFELSVLGEQFEDTPPIFDKARKRLAKHIVTWGFQASREKYLRELASADIFVSTANHEFFGVSAVEAIAAGCYPLLPNRLAYPEVIGDAANPEADQFFYDGLLDQLSVRLTELLEKCRRGTLWTEASRQYLVNRIDSFRWSQLAKKFDDEIELLVVRDN